MAMDMGNEPVPEFGKKMTQKAARAYVDRLYEEVYKRWDRKITQGEFMRELAGGTLSMDVIKLFWKNWYAFVAEINNLIGCSYQRHIWFFKQQRDLYTAFSAKVADELMTPQPPGHILVVLEQGKTFGLTEDEMIGCQMLPECRALLEWHRGLLYEGTITEWWAALADEEPIGHWSKQWREALTAKYGFESGQTNYFKVHEEADLQEHEQGIMGHGELNRRTLQRLLQEGLVLLRPGFSLEYCAFTSVDYLAMFFEGVYSHAREERLKVR
jgi:pyrroloquinoline quinone (PQQ) biosynthesis protein C